MFTGLGSLLNRDREVLRQAPDLPARPAQEDEMPPAVDVFDQGRGDDRPPAPQLAGADYEEVWLVGIRGKQRPLDVADGTVGRNREEAVA